MNNTPSINPDLNDIADTAKHAYATGTKAIADLAYLLAELAGTGRIDPDDALSPLHDRLIGIWEQLYWGTVFAVRDFDTDDSTWDDADNTYSDGRQVLMQVQVEPVETAERHWEYNEFLAHDLVLHHPREMICYIAPLHPDTAQE